MARFRVILEIKCNSAAILGFGLFVEKVHQREQVEYEDKNFYLFPWIGEACAVFMTGVAISAGESWVKGDFWTWGNS